MVTVLNIIAFISCGYSATLAYKLLSLVKDKRFLPIVIALTYASCLRLVYVLIDFNINISRFTVIF